MTTPPLSQADWRKVRALIDERLEQHRRQLESPHHDAAATAMLRGRIAELRELIAWGEPDPKQDEATKQLVSFEPGY